MCSWYVLRLKQNFSAVKSMIAEILQIFKMNKSIDNTIWKSIIHSLVAPTIKLAYILSDVFLTRA